MLQLSPNHWQILDRHAEQTYPQECCGLLLGTLENQGLTASVKALQEIWPAENAWTPEYSELVPDSLGLSRTCRDCYWISPETMLAAQRYCRDQSLAVLGIYHSHPDHPAVPSEMDRVLAWPQYTYLILAIHQGRVENARAWILDDTHQFQSEAIVTREYAKIEPSV